MKKHAPVVPLELAFALEAYAGNGGGDITVRYYCAALCLMLFAALRFCDTLEIKAFWTTKSAVCGVSIGQKSKGRSLMTWGAPKKGFKSKGAWLNPLIAYWEKYKPADGAFRHLFLKTDKNWRVMEQMAAGNNIQSVIAKLEAKFGFPKSI